MKSKCCSVVLVATTALAALSVEAIPTIVVTEAGPSYCYKPYTKHKDMSGITWAGGNKFYVIRNDNHLCEMTVSLDGNGNLTDLPKMSDGIPLEGARDPEGIAYDMASCKVWVSDETGPSIREFDPLTGKRTGREVPIPPVLKRARSNRSLESLTISPDGLTMWTANEEALTCDGGSSLEIRTNKVYDACCTVVRLVKFRRRTVQDAWVLDGMWAYKCRPVGSWAPKASGVSDLVALPDGSLAVLERCVDADSTKYIGECSLYRPNFDNATDVRDYESLADRTSYTPVGMFGSNLIRTYKPGLGYVDDTVSFVSEPTNPTENYDGKGNTSWDASCYEGVCLGPKNKDGSINMMLVSDGGSCERGFGKTYAVTKPFVRALKLTGLNVHTLSVNKPAPAGDPTFYGQNYRFTNGTRVVVDLLGDGVGERAYTNRGDQVYSIDWSLPGHNNKKGKGAHVEFNITNDDTLVWSVASKGKDKTSEIYAHDTFEEYAGGAACSSVKNWSGEGMVSSQEYEPPKGKYILKGEHTKVLDAEDGATRKLDAMELPSSKNNRMDMMVEVHCPRGDLPTTMPGNLKFAIAADKDGCLNIWHYALGTVYDPLLRGNVLVRRNRWNKLSDTKYADATWVHVSAEFRYTDNGAFCRVWLDGVECNNVYGGKATASRQSSLTGKGPWVMLPSSSAPTSLVLKGTKADDLIVATPEFIQSLPASASIMVSPAAVSGASAAGGQAYAVSTAVAAPAAAPAPASSAPSAAQTSQSAVAAPAIVGFGIAPTKRPQIRFTGYAEGVEYRVVCSSTVDFRSASVIDGGIVRVQTGDDGVSVVATWEGAEPSDPASGAKFYRVEVVEAAVE